MAAAAASAAAAPAASATLATPRLPLPLLPRGTDGAVDWAPALWQHFGLSGFRPFQRETVESLVVDRRDTMLVLPTGGGKSLCYQLPAVVALGVTVVVSPLIALMADQVQSLLSKGIPAACLTSAMPESEQRRVLSLLLQQPPQPCQQSLGASSCPPTSTSSSSGSNSTDTGSDTGAAAVAAGGGVPPKVLFVAPERCVDKRFQALLRTLHGRGRLAFFAVDEAHCISTWGHDFRPAFQKLSVLKDAFPEIPILAVTATATQRILADIRKVLKLRKPRQLVASRFRANLFFSVRFKDVIEPGFDRASGGAAVASALDEGLYPHGGNSSNDDNTTTNNRGRRAKAASPLASAAVPSRSGLTSAVAAAGVVAAGGRRSDSNDDMEGSTTAASPAATAATAAADHPQPQSVLNDLVATIHGCIGRAPPTAMTTTATATGGSSTATTPDVAIVYTFKKATADQLAGALQRRGVAAVAYHSGSRDRDGLLRAWLAGEARVIVATIAFGMGIDHAGVRLVVHWDLPKNISAYYQQAGRAGRDGGTALCVLYHSLDDVRRQKYILAQSGQRDRARRGGRGGRGGGGGGARRAAEEFEKVVAYCTLGRGGLHALQSDEGSDGSSGGGGGGAAATAAAAAAAAVCRHAFTLQEFDPAEAAALPGPGGRCCGVSCDLCQPGGVARARRSLERVEELRQQQQGDRRFGRRSGSGRGRGRGVEMRDGVRFGEAHRDDFDDGVDSEEEWLAAQRAAEVGGGGVDEPVQLSARERLSVAAAFGGAAAEVAAEKLQAARDEMRRAEEADFEAFVARRRAAADQRRAAASAGASGGCGSGTPGAAELSSLDAEIAQEMRRLQALSRGGGGGAVVGSVVGGSGGGGGSSGGGGGGRRASSTAGRPATTAPKLAAARLRPIPALPPLPPLPGVGAGGVRQREGGDGVDGGPDVAATGDAVPGGSSHRRKRGRGNAERGGGGGGDRHRRRSCEVAASSLSASERKGRASSSLSSGGGGGGAGARWTQKTSKRTGRVYWFNLASGESTYTRPAGV